MTYAEKLKDPRWQKKRLSILNRDGWRCRDCGDGSKTLHIHHCHYAKGAPWDTPDDLLLTLCASCHEYRQPLEDEARQLFAVICANCPDINGLVGSMRHLSIQKRPTLFLYNDDQMVAQSAHIEKLCKAGQL